MDDLLGDFLAETEESLDVVDAQLVKFERDPNNAEILDNIFRLVHTIKGTCGFLGLPRLERVAHAAENLMGRFREGLPVTEQAVTVVMESIDRIKEILADLEKNQKEPEGSDADLISQLDILSAVGSEPEPAVEAEPEPVAVEAPQPQASLEIGDNSSIVHEVSLEELDKIFDAAPSDVHIPDPLGRDKKPEPAPAAPPMPARQAKPSAEKAEADTPRGEPKKGDVRTKSIRVNVDTLERLMTTVSELVLARNQLLEIGRHIQDGALQAPLQRLSSVTAELQERVMKTRMQPIGNAWQKLPRIIRTLGNDLGKQIELEMTGEDTELDRQVLELIQDPLTHMVRNAADHGLEDTEGRLAAGKPATGRVMLNARHEGGHIVIEIADDGRGLNAEKIRQKAVANGFASAADVEAMSDIQVNRLIFEPGLSTAEAVTNVSGRGVGMDVVRSNIELIGGSVDVISRPGEGSRFTIQIPLTLAIVPALIIGAGEQKFALPQLNIIELVRVRSGDEHSVEVVNGSPILRLRGRLLPLVRLADVFQGKCVKPAPDSEADGESQDGNEFVAVLRIGGFEFGIVADAVFDTEEIVVKPLSGFLKNVKAFSGNTILGDGNVVMIIDPSGIAEIGEMRTSVALGDEVQTDMDNIESSDEMIAMLLFTAGSTDPKALPLALINRLEEIDMAVVEHSGDRDVVQYRDALMPLIRMDDHSSNGNKPVIVIEHNGRHTGLVVDNIVDVVEEHLSIQPGTSGMGTIGSAVVSEKVTEILDLAHYMPETLEVADGKFEKELESQILLIDDSSFFRNMLTPFLSAHGFHVTAVSSATEAMESARRGRSYDIVLSDLEMPDMDGFEFISAVRDSNTWPDAQFIALSGHTSHEIVERTRASGFTDHVAKFDRMRLLDILNNCSPVMRVAA